jgi:hypothetical protein
MKSGKKKKEGSPRGIETMFRIVSSNNIRLSEMADNKSHIMISVNSIILSVIITVLLRRIEQSPNLVIPTVLLLTVNVSALIFAVLASRPHIPDGIVSSEDISRKKINLLFFGNFYKMKLDTYVESMFNLMQDPEHLYTSLMKDNHAQGIVLAKKYKLLRISYSVFMYGIIAATLAFIIATLPALESATI